MTIYIYMYTNKKCSISIYESLAGRGLYNLPYGIQYDHDCNNVKTGRAGWATHSLVGYGPCLAPVGHVLAVNSNIASNFEGHLNPFSPKAKTPESPECASIQAPPLPAPLPLTILYPPLPPPFRSFGVVHGGVVVSVDDCTTIVYCCR